MPASKQIMFLISYDIADPKRLLRTHRILKKQGLPIQYSVFTVTLTQKKLQYLLNQIGKVVDAHDDDLRCYALPAKVECYTIGQHIFPDDVMFFSKGVNHIFT